MASNFVRRIVFASLCDKLFDIDDKVNVVPQLVAYSLYRWEINIRMAAVLGFVGAGGLGQQMDNSMKMFNGSEVATMLLVFMLLVGLADAASAWLRKVIA